jgi:hypothetical protein
VDHRIGENPTEQDRVRLAGGRLGKLDIHGNGPYTGPDGFGPLRVWPGGLALSRAFGDLDVGSFVLCSPYIQQSLLPSTGARIILASDGIWDSFDTYTEVMFYAREFQISEVTSKVQRKAITNRNQPDDNTMIVIDFAPEPGQNWPEICGLIKQSGMKRAFCCAKPEYDEGSSMAHSTRARAKFLASVDYAVGIDKVIPTQSVIPGASPSVVRTDSKTNTEQIREFPSHINYGASVRAGNAMSKIVEEQSGGNLDVEERADRGPEYKKDRLQRMSTSRAPETPEEIQVPRPTIDDENDVRVTKRDKSFSRIGTMTKLQTLDEEEMVTVENVVIRTN